MSAKLHDLHKEQSRIERAYLIGMGIGEESATEVNEQLDELALLADTAGAYVSGRVIQMRPAPDPKFYIGSGKADEIRIELDKLKIDVVILNSDLSPAQLRNLEAVFERKTIDRSTLILDIFARHARTYESKLQVELAQMGYLAPRLTGMWDHFGQQTGGIGTRGPGETQLEVDKRRVKKRISDLREKLEEVELQREESRKSRDKVFKAALVGYTNVGKSTLLNALCKSQVLVANKLFATLDATTRKVFLPAYGEILLSDTVGFIRKLPHHLVASFRSTLGVVTEADLICTVMDASSHHLDEQMEVVNSVLNELELATIPRLLVFNKIDEIEGSPLLERLRTTHPEAIFVSAVQKVGLAEFKEELRKNALSNPSYPAAGHFQYSTTPSSDDGAES